MGCDLSHWAPGRGAYCCRAGRPARPRSAGARAPSRGASERLPPPVPPRPSCPKRAATPPPRRAASPRASHVYSSFGRRPRRLGVSQDPSCRLLFLPFLIPTTRWLAKRQKPGRAELIREPRRRVEPAQLPRPCASSRGPQRGAPARDARTLAQSPNPGWPGKRRRQVLTCPPRLGRWD